MRTWNVFPCLFAYFLTSGELFFICHFEPSSIFSPQGHFLRSLSFLQIFRFSLPRHSSLSIPPPFNSLIPFFSLSVASFPNDLRQVEDKYFRGWPNFNALPTSVQYFAVRLDLVLYSRMCCTPFPSRVRQKVFQGGFNYFQLFSSEKASLCIF